MHLAGRIAETLGKKFKNFADRKSIQKVRLAALMHDTGHSAFSHTSEEVYANCPDMIEFKERNPEFANSGAGEILSFLITTSDPFREYFERIRKTLGKENVYVEVDDFAKLILGKATNPKKQFEAEIISGPFDADKLDYFPRDGRSAGFQLTLDFERLLHCMEIAEIDNLSGNKTAILIVNRGGFNPIQQLLFARATLFATVYHHQKVRACDAMVKCCFEHFRENKLPFRKAPGFKDGVSLESAADYLSITDYDFFAEAALHAEDTFQHRLISNLCQRKLFKRVLSISSRTIEGFHDDKKQPLRYRRLLDMIELPEKLRAMALEILAKSGAECTSSEVWLDIPTTPSFAKAGNARIRIHPGKGPETLMKLSKFIPVEKWVETYTQWYSQCYLFGPEDRKERIALARAAITLFQSRLKLRLMKEAVAEDIRDKVFP
jgi:HD superfamily phosphohydrolase